MRKLRERNLVVIAIVTAVLFVVAALIALNFSKLPLIGSQKNYAADLQTGVGLQSGDVVTIAGVRVGQVTGMHLYTDAQEGAVARVSFEIDKQYHLGSQTTANVKVLNPVGVEYIELDPAGTGTLSGAIPVGRTTVPGTLVGDLNTLSKNVSQTDLTQLVKALQVLTTTFAANSPAQTKAALDGVASLSAVLAGRQQELENLVTQADQLTGLLNSHSSQLVNLLGQSNLLLQVLAQRRTYINNLLTTTQGLTNQIDHIIGGDRSVLDPMLQNLNAVSSYLANDSKNIGAALPLLAAFSRYSANVAGSGPFADFVSPTEVLPDNLLTQCAAKQPLSSLMGCRL